MQQQTKRSSIKTTPTVVQVGIGVLIVNNDGKILLGKRRGAHGAGRWQPPGGKPDVGEKFVDTAKREVLEETGLVVDRVEPITFTDDYFAADHLHFATLYYLARNFRGQPQNMEPKKCEGWQWFGLNELPEPLFLINAILPELKQLI